MDPAIASVAILRDFGALSQPRVAVADASEGEVQGVGVAGEAAGLGDVDDLLDRKSVV